LQLILDYTRKENNPESTKILRANTEHFSKQCLTLLEAFKRGEILTVQDGFKYGIGDLRARVRDLRKAGIDVKDELLEGRYKKYFLGSKESQ
jgi:hypothetical protein